MNWAQENKGLVVASGLMLVAVIAAAVFMFGAMAKYGTAREDYLTAHRRLMKLKTSKPYPSQANVSAKKELVEVYKGEIAGLKKVVEPFFSGFKEVSSSEFIAGVKKLNDPFVDKALAAGMATPEGFFMGMEDYAGRPPKRELTPDLRFQAQGIAFVVNALLEARAQALDFVQRDRLPGEVGAAAAKRPSSRGGANRNALIKHPVTLQFTGAYDSAQRFLNLIANGASNFVIVRALKIENEKKEGPERGTGREAPGLGESFAPEEFAVEGIEGIEGIEGFDLPLEETITPAETVKDAQLVLGGERVRVLVQLELVQFPKKKKAEDKKPAKP